MEELVIWENSTNEEVLNNARAEILKSCDGELRIMTRFPVAGHPAGGAAIGSARLR